MKSLALLPLLLACLALPLEEIVDALLAEIGGEDSVHASTVDMREPEQVEAFVSDPAPA